MYVCMYACVCVHTYIHTYIYICINVYVCVCVCVCTHIYTQYTVSEIVGLASQFATQNCLCCYSKLNLSSEFHAEVANHLPYIKLRTHIP